MNSNLGATRVPISPTERMKHAKQTHIKKEKKLNKILLTLIAFILSACATKPVTLPKTWAYSEPDATTIVAAIGVSKNGNFKSLLPYHFFIIDSEFHKEGLLVKADYDPGFMNSVKDYETIDGKYGLVKFKVKPGKYKIRHVEAYSPVGITINSQEPFEIPFNLEPNKNYYLGTFTAHDIATKGSLGIKSIIGTYWIADTISEPNKVAIVAKFPELTNIELETFKQPLEFPPYFFRNKNDAELFIKNNSKTD
jgi:hypothetical protein